MPLPQWSPEPLPCNPQGATEQLTSTYLEIGSIMVISFFHSLTHVYTGALHGVSLGGRARSCRSTLHTAHCILHTAPKAIFLRRYSAPIVTAHLTPAAACPLHIHLSSHASLRITMCIHVGLHIYCPSPYILHLYC